MTEGTKMRRNELEECLMGSEAEKEIEKQVEVHTKIHFQCGKPNKFYVLSHYNDL